MKPRIRVPSNEYLNWMWIKSTYERYKKTVRQHKLVKGDL